MNKLVIGLTVAMTGCASIQTNQTKVDLIMDKHLPPFTTVTFMDEYDLQKKHGGVLGVTTRHGGAIHTYHIDTVVDPVVLLHEFCHVMQWDFHKGYSHHGLVGCDHFNYDTINEVTR